MNGLAWADFVSPEILLFYFLTQAAGAALRGYLVDEEALAEQHLASSRKLPDLTREKRLG